MKHLNVILLACFLFASGVSYAQDDDLGKGAYLEAHIQPSKRELRKHRKKMMVEREIDSLIVSQNFKFKPAHMYTLIQAVYEFAPLIIDARKFRGPVPADVDFIRIHDGWLETKLFHEWLPLDNYKVYGLKYRDPDLRQKMYEIPLELPPVAFNFKFTESTKEEDKTWFITIEVDRIGQKCKYEFVVQPTGWTVLRCTSNRWGKNVIYTGWLVRT